MTWFIFVVMGTDEYPSGLERERGGGGKEN